MKRAVVSFFQVVRDRLGFVYVCFQEKAEHPIHTRLRLTYPDRGCLKMTHTQQRVQYPLTDSLKLLDFKALGAPHLATDIWGTPLLGRLRGTPSKLNIPMKRE